MLEVPNWLLIILMMLTAKTFHNWLHDYFQRLIKKHGYKWFYWNVYLKMPSWKLARFLKKLFWGKKCRVCKGTHWIDVHHLNYDHPWLEWFFLWDLDVLCRQHHSQEHPNYHKESWQA